MQNINERGIVHEGQEYPLDVLIYATGFQWMGTASFNMIEGVGGRSLKDKWQEEGTRTFLGIHREGFPNLFIMSGPQGGGGQFNFIRGLEAHSDYIVWMMETMRTKGAMVVDVRKDLEIEYAEHCRQVDNETSPLRDCVSYYIGDGTAEPGSLAYYGGPAKWHERRGSAQQSMAPYIFVCSSK